MKHQLNNKFNLALNYQNLEGAYRRAKRNKLGNEKIAAFEKDLEYNLTTLLKELTNQTYRPGAYYKFMIHEPKERLIWALPFRDRVVQQWFVEELIIPHFVPKFSYDSHACVREHGTHLAYKRLQRFLHYGEYAIKMDISKFFPSINKDILWKVLQREIKDGQVLWLARTFVYDTPNTKGIPIGNYTSQYFANIYLNELDQYIKRELKVRNYIRYMDDFVLICGSKDEALKLFEQCREFLQQKLDLQLNGKSRIIKISRGVPFCGFTIFPTHIKLSQNNKRSVKHMVRKFRVDHDREAFLASLTGWRAHVSHANSYNYQTKIYREICAEFFDLAISCPHHEEFQPDCMDCYAAEMDRRHIWEILREFLAE
ncbi:MAG: reverse transcriptase/maturase family protein [Candidatus Nomurabacteria bacterium]|jgi:retron-type reverse transcriptase|nr:reverse transcriptase/maturase family protein [Candidatus Nomurabacteria bacterium]